MLRVNYKVLVGLALASTLVFLLSAYYINVKQKQFSRDLIKTIITKEQAVFKLADQVNKAQLTEPLASFIKNCSRKQRARFDILLDKLAELTPDEIENMEPLFEACAANYADTKTALVYQFQGELQTLEVLVNLAQTLDLTDVITTPLDAWNKYLVVETSLAKALQEQVDLQFKVMTLLKDGKLQSDPEIQSLLEAASNLSKQASLDTKTRDEIFAQLKK